MAVTAENTQNWALLTDSSGSSCPSPPMHPSPPQATATHTGKLVPITLQYSWPATMGGIWCHGYGRRHHSRIHPTGAMLNRSRSTYIQTECCIDERSTSGQIKANIDCIKKWDTTRLVTQTSLGQNDQPRLGCRKTKIGLLLSFSLGVVRYDCAAELACSPTKAVTVSTPPQLTMFTILI